MALTLTDRLVLDTSAYSRLRCGHPGVVESLSLASVVLVPVVVLGELEGGFRAGSRYEANHRLLVEFLSEPFVEVLDTTRGVAARYGVIFATLRAAGNPIPVNDIWIAAHTLEAGGHLLTFDSDFEKVPDLQRIVLAP